MGSGAWQLQPRLHIREDKQPSEGILAPLQGSCACLTEGTAQPGVRQSSGQSGGLGVGTGWRRSYCENVVTPKEEVKTLEEKAQNHANSFFCSFFGS